MLNLLKLKQVFSNQFYPENSSNNCSVNRRNKTRKQQQRMAALLQRPERSFQRLREECKRISREDLRRIRGAKWNSRIRMIS
jgi:hypothetical protein